jgi:hypothetical protein
MLAAGPWYQRWRKRDESERNPFRACTVRAIRQAERELNIDFVVQIEGHNPRAGPDATWLAGASEDDEIVNVGLDDRSIDCRPGLLWRPGVSTSYSSLNRVETSPSQPLHTRCFSRIARAIRPVSPTGRG